MVLSPASTESIIFLPRLIQSSVLGALHIQHCFGLLLHLSTINVLLIYLVASFRDGWEKFILKPRHCCGISRGCIEPRNRAAFFTSLAECVLKQRICFAIVHDTYLCGQGLCAPFSRSSWYFLTHSVMRPSWCLDSSARYIPRQTPSCQRMLYLLYWS